jgi:ubiquinol-cytochrome c reductase cytochrome c subunit
MDSPVHRLRSAFRRHIGSSLRRRLLAGPLAVLAIGAAGFGLFAGLGSSTSAAPAAVSTDSSTILAGEAAYNLHCSSCHGVAGSGTTRAPALTLVGAAAADFYLSTGRMPLNNPHDEPLRHHPFFTPGVIKQIVSYIAALPKITGTAGEGPGIPSVLPLCSGSEASNPNNIEAQQKAGTANCVTLSFGQETYSLNCAQCHQIAGRGGLLSKGNVIPTLQNANLIQTAEAMRIGPGSMPKFGNEQLTEVQVSAIAHYVHYLQRPNHDGGLTISGFGPVAEGFVGIIVGLGLLLLVSRLMGIRG